MEIKQELITFNRSYQKLTPLGIVVHGTDTPGATDQNEHDYFNEAYRASSANGFVDWDSITQLIPWNEVSWGSGSTSNHKFIQIELCQPSSHNQEQFEAVWNNAVFLFAKLLVEQVSTKIVTKDNVLSHAEISALYHETDHTDPVEYFAEYGKTVDQFRQAIQEQINKGDVDMNKIVTYLGDADLFGAVIVAQKNACPLMRKADFDASGLKATEVIQIGGKPSSTRFTTFKDAAALV